MSMRFADESPPLPGRPPWLRPHIPPGRPGQPGPAPHRPGPAPSPAAAPARVWAEEGDWPGRLYGRLLDHRIVMVHGFLDEQAATRLSAQILTVDAESAKPIQLQMQNLDADLGAALTVMGVLDTLRAKVTAQAGGRISGPALGVFAASHYRRAYASAIFAFREPTVAFSGTAESLAAQEGLLRSMLDDFYGRLASVSGRDVNAIRADARSGRVLTTEQAIGYGLVEEAL